MRLCGVLELILIRIIETPYFAEYRTKWGPARARPPRGAGGAERRKVTARTCIVGAQSKKRRAEPSRARRRCLAAGLGARASRPPRYRVGRTAALLHASSAPRRWSQRARLIAGGDAGEHGRRRRAAVRDDSCREVNLSTQRTAAPRAARWCEAGLGAPAGLEDATRRAAAGPLRVK